jgi:lactate dehydrogenase-like 2-hydroxyacid dehydrogenase
MFETEGRQWSVVTACPLPKEAADQIAAAFDTVSIPSERPDPDEVIAALDSRDALIFTVTLPITADFVARLPASVGALCTYSVGFEHIDLEACRNRGIAVLNTPDVLTDAVAEVAILLLLGAARRVKESLELLQSKAWRGWQPTQLNGVGLNQKTLGIVGMGRIGRAIAERARAFGMAIRYHNRTRLDPDLEGNAVWRASIDDLLAESDAVVLAAPASATTTGLINRDRLAITKPGAIIVNIGRGNLVDDDALIEALQNGRIGAAGLDVFNSEPAIDDRYRHLPNVFATPHIGSATIETRARMAQILVDGLLALRAHAAVANRIA